MMMLGLLVLCYISGIAVTETYKKGGEAVLSPGSVSNTITSITWKHGVDIAVEWYGQETITYRDFKGRCEVDTTTGALTISNLSLKDSGSYTAEINNRIMETTEIKVITAVPKPTISTHCNPELTQCTFTCDASITADTGPIIYSWQIGDRQNPSSGKQLNITKDDTESVGKLISCQLINPVSSERSDDITIPFTNWSSEGVIIAAVTVAIVLVLIALGILTHYLWWRRRRAESENAGCRQYVAWLKRSCLNCGRTERTAEGGAALDQTHSNGVGKPEGTAEEMTSLVTTQNNGSVAFSVENETLNQDQILGSPEAKNQTESALKQEQRRTKDFFMLCNSL